MPIERNTEPQGIEVVMMEADEAPEIEIEIGPEGVEIEIEEEDEKPFDANLAEILDPSVLAAMSSDLMALFEADQASRKDWEEQYAKGLDLLGFKMEERSRPFKGAAGAAHPLLAEAIVQFQAQSLKELMPADGPVRTQVLGKETRERLAQAARVKDFMNYQITTVMEEYTPEFDQLLFYVGYGGSAFKKVCFDPTLNRMVSTLVLPDDLYIPYRGSSVMSRCERITHRIFMSRNTFLKSVIAGRYLDDAQATTIAETSQIMQAQDKVVGIEPSGMEEEITLLEFQIDYDVPGFEHKGEDGEPTGLKLPYIITLDEHSGKVVGVRRNWKEDGDDGNGPVGKYLRKEYYVHYMLVQGPGAYGLGFVHLIGGLSKAATSAMRQLLDAGTLSNLPGGLKAKGARIMNPDEPIAPGEWRDMDAGGMELSASLFVLPYKEPSQTLFTLMGSCVDSGRRLASITDLQVGDSNQNAAVGTTIALLEKGSSVMSAVHKRLHYSQGIEFKLLAKGFAEFLPDEYPYDVPGESRMIKAKDFDDRIDVVPVSDPNIFSVAQRITMAQTELQLAQSAPQMHNMYEAYRRMYEAIGVRDIDGLLVSQNVDKPKDPVSENSQALDGSPLKAFAGQQHDAHIAAHLMFSLSPMVGGNPQVASSLQKHIFDHIRLKAEEAVEAELFTQYGVDPEQRISPLQREAMVAIKTVEFFQAVKQLQTQLAGPPPEDPLIKVKEQEIQMRGQRDAAKTQIDQARLQLDQQKEANDERMDQANLALKTQAAAQRAAQPAFSGPNSLQ